MEKLSIRNGIPSIYITLNRNALGYYFHIEIHSNIGIHGIVGVLCEFSSLNWVIVIVSNRTCKTELTMQ